MAVENKLLKLNISTFNDEIHDTIANFTFTTFDSIENIFIYFEVRVQESDDDTKYLRTLFRSSIDGRKFLGGVRGNILISRVFDTVTKNADFELSLPKSPGTYSFINVRFPGYYIPLKSVNILGVFNASARLGKTRKKIWMYTVHIHGRLTK